MRLLLAVPHEWEACLREAMAADGWGWERRNLWVRWKLRTALGLAERPEVRREAHWARWKRGRPPSVEEAKRSMVQDDLEDRERTALELLASHRTSLDGVILYHRFKPDSVPPEDRGQVPSGVTEGALLGALAQGLKEEVTSLLGSPAGPTPSTVYTPAKTPFGLNLPPPPFTTPLHLGNVVEALKTRTTNLLDRAGFTQYQTDTSGLNGGP